MSNSVEKTLYRTAAVIFEELGFMLPNPVTRPIGGEPIRGAAVLFHGPFSGMLLLRVTRDITPFLAANMLGEDQPPDERLEYDAVGEIANVICGNVLPVLSDSDAPFNLEAPRYFEDPAQAGLGPSHSLHAGISLGIDRGKADVSLYMSGPVGE
jgi:hypothetical protein